MARHLGRRAALAALASGVVGSLAGCARGASFDDADVIAGPAGRDVFEPESLTIQIGETVTWGFASSGHNVSCRPQENDHAALPEDAQPFASYGADESPLGTTVPQGETYEHTFEVAGTYVYICVPHADRGMIGTVRVEAASSSH